MGSVTEIRPVHRDTTETNLDSAEVKTIIRNKAQ